MVSRFNKIFFTCVPLFCISLPMLIVGVFMKIDLGKVPPQYEYLGIYSYYSSISSKLLIIGSIIFTFGFLIALLITILHQQKQNGPPHEEEIEHEGRGRKRKISGLLLANVPLQSMGMTLLSIGLFGDPRYGGLSGDFIVSFDEFPIWAAMGDIVTAASVIGLILSILGILLVVIYFIRRSRSRRKNVIDSDQ